MTDGMFRAKCLSQYKEILSKTRLFGTGKNSKLGRTVGGKKGNRTEPNHRIIPDRAYGNFRYLRYRVLPPSPAEPANATFRANIALFLMDFLNLITHISRFYLSRLITHVSRFYLFYYIWVVI